MSVHIIGLGTATPRHGISQADSAEIAASLLELPDRQRRAVPALYRRTGVERRFSALLEQSEGRPLDRQSFYATSSVGMERGPTTADRMIKYEQEAVPLAVESAGAALCDAGIEAASISHLITVSCTGFGAPGFDLELLRALGCRPATARCHVGFMGCHGALNALRVARAFVDADPAARVLLCAVELCSLHHQYSEANDQIVANALFADGAAALVCAASWSAAQPLGRIASNAATVIPDSQDAMHWRIRDHGFEMSLSARVPELIHRHLRPWLDEWLAANQLRTADIGAWAIHPGGPRILSASAEAAGLPPERLADSKAVLESFGNMSSPTVLFILDQLRRRHAPFPYVLLGFGPGLAMEAALVTDSHPAEKMSKENRI